MGGTVPPYKMKSAVNFFMGLGVMKLGKKSWEARNYTLDTNWILKENNVSGWIKTYIVVQIQTVRWILADTQPA